MTQLLTNSRLRTFLACQRLHQIRYVAGYQAVDTADVLVFGDLVHVALEAWWKAHQAGLGPVALSHAIEAIKAKAATSERVDDVAAAKAELLMVGYDARWSAAMADLEVLGVETQFRAPLPGATGQPCAGVQQAGKLDVLARKRSDGTVWLVEHKTAGGDISPTSSYWQRLRMEPQVSMYYVGAKSLGYELAGCIYDVIQRPDTKPYSATPMDKRKYTKAGALYANQREFDETLDEFKARLAAAIAAEPNEYYQRAEVVRLPDELEEFKADVLATWLQIKAAERAGHVPRNPDACHRYGRPCQFYEVCSGAASLDDESKYVRLESVHPELET